MVLSRDLKADGHVVLGLNVDAKTVFHGAQAHRGGLAVDHGHLHVEARVDDTVELTQALDDYGVLLLNDVTGVGEQQQQDDDGNQKAGKGGDDTGKQHGLSSDRHTLVLGYPSKEIVHNKKSSHCWELFQSMVRAKGRPRIRFADPHRLRPPAGVLASSLKTLRVFFTLAPSQVQVPAMGP